MCDLAYIVLAVQGKSAVFVLFVWKLDVETVDIELLLYHVFKVGAIKPIIHCFITNLTLYSRL